MAEYGWTDDIRWPSKAMVGDFQAHHEVPIYEMQVSYRLRPENSMRGLIWIDHILSNLIDVWCQNWDWSTPCHGLGDTTKTEFSPVFWSWELVQSGRPAPCILQFLTFLPCKLKQLILAYPNPNSWNILKRLNNTQRNILITSEKSCCASAHFAQHLATCLRGSRPSRRAAVCLTGHLRTAILDPLHLFIEPLQQSLLRGLATPKTKTKKFVSRSHSIAI